MLQTAEEIHLNPALEKEGFRVVETDLGEWDDDIDVNYIYCPKAEFEKYFKEN